MPSSSTANGATESCAPSWHVVPSVDISGNGRRARVIQTPKRHVRTVLLVFSQRSLFPMKLSALALTTAVLLAAPVSAQDINDAQIAAIVVTANQVDIDAGALAAKVSTNAEVKKFANQMVTDHTGVNKAAVELVT